MTHGREDGAADLYDTIKAAAPKPPARPTRPTAPRERNIQKHILNWLVAHGYLFSRTNSGDIVLDDGRHFRGATPGWPDLTGLTKRGRFCGIEVKTPTGRQSPSQRAMQARIEASGGLYILARSVADVQAALGDA